MARQNRQLWAAVGGIAAVLTLAWTIAAHLRAENSPAPSMVAVFLIDSAGLPATDARIFLNNGIAVEPDLNGIAQLPASRAGESASVRQRSTRRELCLLVVPAPTAQLLRINITDERGGPCR